MLKLRTKLVIIFIVCAVALTVILATLLSRDQSDTLRKLSLAAYGEIIVNLADRVGESIRLGNWALADMIMSEHLNSDTAVEWGFVENLAGKREITYLRDRRQGIESFSDEETIAELTQPLSLGRSIVKTSVTPLDASGALVFSVPLAFKNEPFGRFVVAVKQDAFAAYVQRTVHQFTLYSVIMIFSGALLIWVLVGWITFPIEHLSTRMSQLLEVKELNEAALNDHALRGLRGNSLESATMLRMYRKLLRKLRQSFVTIRQLSRRELEIRRLEAIVKTTRYLAHDIRAPFSQIRAFLECLSGLPVNTATAQVLERGRQDINAAYERVNQMLEDILDFGSQQNGPKVPTSVASLIKEAVRDHTQGVARTGHRIEIDFTHRSLAMLNKTAFRRVISNLITNAEQAMHEPGVIKITTSEVSARLYVKVHNNGSFVAEDQRDAIFEPFITHKNHGTGLGLAFCREIVSSHGGTIHCESDLDRGTSFVLELPASKVLDDYSGQVFHFEGNDNHHKPSLAVRVVGVEFLEVSACSPTGGQEQSTTPSGLPKLLVVDDDPWIRSSWEARNDQFAVRTFACPAAFLAELGNLNDEVDTGEALIIVTDYHFVGSEWNGLSLARALRKQGVICPILLATDDMSVKPNPRDGISAVIEKLQQDLSHFFGKASTSVNA